MQRAERQTDARAGSAWDTWHKAGWDHAVSGGAVEGVDLDIAAGRYAVERDCRIATVERAFRAGARQFAAGQRQLPG